MRKKDLQKLRSYFLTVMAWTTGMAILGCGGGEDTPEVPVSPQPGTTQFTMDISPDTLRIPADVKTSGTFTVALNKASSFYAKADKEWCTLADADGSGKTAYTVKVSTTANQETTERLAKVSFHSGDVTKYAYVLQEAGKKEEEEEASFTVSPDTLYINADGKNCGAFSVKFKEKSSFYAKAEEEWAGLEYAEGNGHSEYTVPVKASANDQTTSRISKATFYSRASSKVVYIFQKAAEKNQNNDQGTYQITVIPEGMEFSGYGQQNSFAVTVTPAAVISVKSDVHWCTPVECDFTTPETAFKVPVKVDDNLGDKRTTSIIIQAGASSVTVPITQRSIAEDHKDIGGSVADEVDLGLSVLWASHNVGASSQTEAGGFFAWGEIDEKDDYDENTYIYYNTNLATYTDIGEGISGRRYDAATIYWRNGWRMPTWAEMYELMTKCEWEWVQINKVNGYRVTGPSGKSIFLPAQGSKAYMMHTGKNTDVKLWTDCLSPSNKSKAYGLSASSTSISRYHAFRSRGMPIRPVKYKGSGSGSSGNGNAGGGVAWGE